MAREPNWDELAKELDSIKAVVPLRAEWRAYVGSEEFGIWLLRPDGPRTEQVRASFSLIAARAIARAGIAPIPVPQALQHCPHWAEYCAVEEELAHRGGKALDLSDAVPSGLDRVDPCTRAFLEVLRLEGRTFRVTTDFTETIKGKAYPAVAGVIEDLCGGAAAYCKRQARDEIARRLEHHTPISRVSRLTSLSIEQEDAAANLGFEVLKRQPGWDRTQERLCQMNLRLSRRSAQLRTAGSNRQEALRHFTFQALVYLDLVSDSETADAFCKILPLFVRVVYLSCLGAPPQSVSNPSESIQLFERKIEFRVWRWKVKAYQRAQRLAEKIGTSPTETTVGDHPSGQPPPFPFSLDPFDGAAEDKPIGENPFPVGHAAYEAFEEATWKAKEGINSLKTELLERFSNPPFHFIQEILTYRVKAFTACANAALLIVGNDETGAYYENWIDGFAKFILEDTLRKGAAKSPEAEPDCEPLFSANLLPQITVDLHVQLMKVVAHYKKEAASRALQARRLREASLPTTDDAVVNSTAQDAAPNDVGPEPVGPSDASTELSVELSAIGQIDSAGSDGTVAPVRNCSEMAEPSAPITAGNIAHELLKGQASMDKGNSSILRSVDGELKRAVTLDVASRYGGVSRRAIEKAAKKGALASEGEGPNRRILVQSLLKYFPPEENTN